MPSFDEQIRGEREAIRVQREMIDSVRKDKLWRADLRQLGACILMAFAGLAFAILLMLAAMR